MTKDEKIAKLGKEITDRATVLLGKDKITPDAPEYLGINSALKFTAVKYDEKMADDILDIALTMKKRVPLTIEQLAKKNPQFDRAYLEKAMQAISESGLVEFHWENLDGKNPNHEKRWVLDMFVPGSAEIMMINPEQADMFPETADFFERMAYLPLAGITEMVPPGGAGIGMHVIPVEKGHPGREQVSADRAPVPLAEEVRGPHRRVRVLLPQAAAHPRRGLRRRGRRVVHRRRRLRRLLPRDEPRPRHHL